MNQTLPFRADTSVRPEIVAFFDEPTNTISYIVKDPNSDACAVVDSVMDIDYAAGRITYEGADAIIRHIEEQGWKLAWIIETHVHADHLSAAPYIQQKLGGKLGIGENITIVQDTFGKVFNEGTEFRAATVSQFCRPSVLSGREGEILLTVIGTMTRLCDAHPRPHAGLHDAMWWGRHCARRGRQRLRSKL